MAVIIKSSDGKSYRVDGGGGGQVTATNVAYDNAASGLQAENVQRAIDAVAGENISDFSYIPSTEATGFKFVIKNGVLYINSHEPTPETFTPTRSSFLAGTVNYNISLYGVCIATGDVLTLHAGDGNVTIYGLTPNKKYNSPVLNVAIPWDSAWTKREES